jgi:hypothetical protein
MNNSWKPVAYPNLYDACQSLEFSQKHCPLMYSMLFFTSTKSTRRNAQPLQLVIRLFEEKKDLKDLKYLSGTMIIV